MPAVRSAAFHFFTGSDEAAVKKAAKARCIELAPGADALRPRDHRRRRGHGRRIRLSHQETIQALLTLLPSSASSKVVWLKSAAFLSDSIAGRSDSVQETLEALIKVLEEGLPDGITFLHERTPARQAAGRFTRLSLNSEKPRCSTFPTLDSARARKRSSNGPHRACGARTSSSPRGGGETLAASRGVRTPPAGERTRQARDGIWEDAQGRSPRHPRTRPADTRRRHFRFERCDRETRPALALETLRMLVRQGEKGVGILLAAVMPTVRNLLLAKELLTKHKLPPPAQAHFFAGALKKLPDSAIAHLPRKKDGTINAYPLGLAAMNSSPLHPRRAHRRISRVREGEPSAAQRHASRTTSSSRA